MEDQSEENLITEQELRDIYYDPSQGYKKNYTKKQKGEA